MGAKPKTSSGLTPYYSSEHRNMLYELLKKHDKTLKPANKASTHGSKKMSLAVDYTIHSQEKKHQEPK